MHAADRRRYLVEQLGYQDWGVWDTRTEVWVTDGSQAHCEDVADRLNTKGH
ncbi:hypothetical protein ABZ851_29910 [Streptomyces sp. NPDC047049]|uniref:hypothetical protein n=1 Tax=Streptomyces sp. NPDC047049 TaxID=3156688 RepID=UPI003409E54A